MSRWRDALDAWRGGPVDVEVKEAPGAELVVSTSEVGRPVTLPWTYDYLERVTLTATSTIAACGDFWARNLSEPNIIVTDAEGAPIDHPLSRLFAKPNPFYTQDELWQAVVYQLCESEQGSFLLAPLSRAGEPLALWPKSSDEVRVIPSKTDFVGRYEMRTGPDSWQPIDPAQVAVVWFRLIHPSDKWRSYPPVGKVRREIRTEGSIGRWLDYALQNMGSTSGLVGVEHPDVDQRVADGIRDYLNEAVAGANNAKKFAVAAGKVTAREFGTKFSELDFGPLQDRLEVACARAFGIAPELVHTLATTAAGSGLGGERQRELKAAAYEDTLIPIGKMLAAKVGGALGPAYGLDPELVVFDFSTVQALSDDTGAAVTRAKDAEKYWTVDECRAETGKPPYDDPVIGGQIVAIATKPAPSPVLAPVKVAAGTVAPAEDKATVAQTSLRATVDAKARAIEPRFAAVARAAFAKQRAQMKTAAGKAVTHIDPATARPLMGGGVAVEVDGKAGFGDLLDAVDGLGGDWEGLDELVGEAFAAGAGPHETGLGVSFSLTNPRTAKAVQARVTKVVGLVDDTTRNELRDVITAGRESGASLRDTIKAIESVFDKADTSRAETIARTESIGSANQGGYELAQQAAGEGLGVVKTWIAFADEKTRESHILMDGTDADLDEPFDNGLMYPGDEDGDAEEVINCRCSCGYTAGGPGPDEVTN